MIDVDKYQTFSLAEGTQGLIFGNSYEALKKQIDELKKNFYNKYKVNFSLYLVMNDNNKDQLKDYSEIKSLIDSNKQLLNEEMKTFSNSLSPDILAVKDLFLRFKDILDTKTV